MSARADVVVIGAGHSGRRAAIGLLDAGISNILVLEKDDAARQTWRRDFTDRLRLGREVVTAAFDHTTDSWLLSTRSKETFHAGVVIAAHGPLHVMKVPEFHGRDDFCGTAFHAAQPDPDFDPAGKRIALIGADVVRALPRLAPAGAVTIFHHAPNLPDKKPQRRVIRIRNRLLRRRNPALPLPPNVELVTADVERITGAGVRTVDGAQHDVDAIVYATGYAPAEAVGDEAFTGTGGVTLRQMWRNGAEAYLGTAVHGLPNFFLIDGPYAEGDPMRHIVECLNLMRAADSTRIEVRRSAQRTFVDRCWRGPAAWAFEVTGGTAVQAEVYDGPAVLTVADQPCPVRARLTGHIDPVDGKYHWQGTLFGTPADLPIGPVQLAVENRCAPGRVTETTPWGHCVVGVGAPPFSLDESQLEVADAAGR